AFQGDERLGRFLLAFERILTGLGAPDPATVSEIPPGIEQILDRIYTYFDPVGTIAGRAPDEFLPWLASWVATSLRDDWDSQTRRNFIRNMASLYQKRGTRDGLVAMLELYTGVSVTVDDSSKVPYYFNV